MLAEQPIFGRKGDKRGGVISASSRIFPAERARSEREEGRAVSHGVRKSERGRRRFGGKRSRVGAGSPCTSAYRQIADESLACMRAFSSCRVAEDPLGKRTYEGWFFFVKSSEGRGDRTTFFAKTQARGGGDKGLMRGRCADLFSFLAVPPL